MSDTPPRLSVYRPDESIPAAEMPMARAWLQHLRDSAIFKLDGLDDDQLRWQPAATANSLGAIALHLGYAERLWLRVIFAGEQMDRSWREHMFELFRRGGRSPRSSPSTDPRARPLTASSMAPRPSTFHPPGTSGRRSYAGSSRT
jgi:hypothetical protein